MNLNVITDEKQLGGIMSDLSRRRADICEFTSRGHSRVRRFQSYSVEMNPKTIVSLDVANGTPMDSE